MNMRDVYSYLKLRMIEVIASGVSLNERERLKDETIATLLGKK